MMDDEYDMFYRDDYRGRQEHHQHHHHLDRRRPQQQDGLSTNNTNNASIINNNIIYNTSSNADIPIIQTADDAIRCKQATVSTGYYNDPFLSHMTATATAINSTSTTKNPSLSSTTSFINSQQHNSHPNHQQPQRSLMNHHRQSSSHSHHSHHHNHNQRPRQVQPIIKRGTYARVCVMDRAINSFIDHVKTKTTTTTTRTRSDDGGGNGGGSIIDRSSSSSSSPSSSSSSSVGCSCQIVVLGAGKDTTYFRYINGNLLGKHQQQQQQQQQSKSESSPSSSSTTTTTTDRTLQVRWYEVDHQSVVEEKAQLIQSSNLLSTFCPDLQRTQYGFCSLSSSSLPTPSQASSSSSEYNLIGHDLRESPALLLDDKLKSLDPTIPTLFLMECVSMYLPVESYRNLIKTITTWCSQQSQSTTKSSGCYGGGGGGVTLVCYEALLGPDDRLRNPFGTMMEQNLVRANVAIPGSCLLELRTLEDQLDMLLLNDDDSHTSGRAKEDEEEAEMMTIGRNKKNGGGGGFDYAVGCDMWSAYQTVLTDRQRIHANSSEFLDEYEEFVLIMQHYSLIVATTTATINTKQKDDGNFADSGGSGSVSGLMTVGGGSPMGFQVGKCIEKKKSMKMATDAS